MNSLNIDNLRTEIDREHRLIFESLLRRFALAEKIWEIKKEHSLALVDTNREKNLLSLFDLEPAMKNPELQKALKNIFQKIIEENKNYLNSKFQTENSSNKDARE